MLLRAVSTRIQETIRICVCLEVFPATCAGEDSWPSWACGNDGVVMEARITTVSSVPWSGPSVSYAGSHLGLMTVSLQGLLCPHLTGNNVLSTGSRSKET